MSTDISAPTMFGIETQYYPNRSIPLEELPPGHFLDSNKYPYSTEITAQIDSSEVFISEGFIMCKGMLFFSNTHFLLRHSTPEFIQHHYETGSKKLAQPLKRLVIFMQPTLAMEFNTLGDKISNFINEVIFKRLHKHTEKEWNDRYFYSNFADMAHYLLDLIDSGATLPEINVITTQLNVPNSVFTITVGNSYLVIWDQKTQNAVQKFKLTDLRNWNLEPGSSLMSIEA